MKEEALLEELKEKLRLILKKKALKKGRFILSSGKLSNFYLDVRLVSLSAEGAYLIGRIILEMIKEKNISALGGPTLGADPILGAVASLNWALYKKPLNTFIVRKSPKEHGRCKLIEGPVLGKKDKVILIDDVATTGGSLLQAQKALLKLGIKPKEAIVVVDREEGAKENLSRAGIKLNSILTLKDIIG